MDTKIDKSKDRPEGLKINPDETKREKSKRLITIRTRHVIKRLDQLKFLSGPSYDLKKEEVEKVMNTIQEKLTSVRNSFEASTKKDKEKFTL